ncbi:MAG TPA: hypothetical protein PKM65_07010 [Spirochaetota bacterium]|nr:hypothetical protein [Spirochaetota bacterium]HNT09894.1 hypothetical protein [Spirochaetota bacterium]
MINREKSRNIPRALARRIIRWGLAALAIACIAGPAAAQRTKSSLRAGEQVKAEKGLKDNRYFFYFINASITNFGTDDEKKAFTEAVRRDILAQFLYMRFMFYESYTEIRHSQKILIDLYRKVLIKDIAMSKELLNRFAPAVVEVKDGSALEYLHLGYRDMKVAEQYLLMADNFRRDLYSMRLYKYVHAIKTAKHGKKYAFLGALLARDMDNVFKRKRTERMAQFDLEQLVRKTKLAIRQLSFDALSKRIAEIPPPEQTAAYQTMHLDSVYRSREPKSLYDAIWEEPRVSELPEYKRYIVGPEN